MAASLLSTETLHVLNVSHSGALVEGALPLPINAEYDMQFVLHSQVSEVTVKVRRVHAVGRDPGSMRYRIGLEFLAVPPDAEEAIRQLVLAAQAQV